MPILDASSLIETEHARRQATVANDIEALEAMTADFFLYYHISGLVEDRAIFFDRLHSGAPRITGTSASDLSVELRNNYALLTGKSYMELGEKSFNTNFLSVWEADGNRWKIAAYTSIPLPGANYDWL